MKYKKNFLEKFLIICRECFRDKTLERTLYNIHLISKKPFSGRGIDFGVKNTSSSYYRFIDISNAVMTYTDFYSQSEKVKSIDFEKDFDLSNEAYDFAIVNNTLEHIYNYQNFMKNINKSLVKGGTIEGSIPFLHPYHKDPDDYFRFTHTALKKILEKANFENIKITPICQGAFSAFVSMISTILKFKLLKITTWAIAILLDLMLNKIFKNNLNIYACLAFTATKKK